MFPSVWRLPCLACCSYSSSRSSLSINVRRFEAACQHGREGGRYSQCGTFGAGLGVVICEIWDVRDRFTVVAPCASESMEVFGVVIHDCDLVRLIIEFSWRRGCQ